MILDRSGRGHRLSLQPFVAYFGHYGVLPNFTSSRKSRGEATAIA